MHVRTVRNLCLLLMFCFAGSACSLSFSSNPATATLPSRVQIEMIPPEYAIQGEPADYTFVITNQTNYTILPLELLPISRDVAGGPSTSRIIKPVQDGAVHHWTHLLHGPLKKRPKTDVFVYSPSNLGLPTKTKGRIHSGLLRPGQTLRVNLRMLHLEKGRYTQHFSLRYHRTTSETLQKRMYVPDQPLNKRRARNIEIRFENQTSGREGRIEDIPFFLTHPPYQIVVEQTLSRDIRVFEGSFQPSEAKERLKKELKQNDVDQMRFDPWNNRWIVRMQNNQIWGVSRESIERLPEGIFMDFKHLATAHGTVFFYPGPRMPKNKQDILPLNAVPNEDGSRKKRRTTVRTAIDLLQTLRESGLHINWTREPLTNHPAVIVRRSRN